MIVTITAPEAKPVPAVAAIVLDEDRLLLVKRANEPHKGHWSFPGGSIEPSESSAEAVRRELMEECGLEVQVLAAVDVWDAICPPESGHGGFHYVIGQYLAVPTAGTAIKAASDATDARWVPLGELGGYSITDVMERILEKAVRVRDRIAAKAASDKKLPVARDRARLRGVYLVSDDRLRPGRSHVEIARAAVNAGVGIVQLRDKHRETGELVGIARQIRAITSAAGCLFIVNDRVDVALAAGADGVHLGVDDMSVADARTLLGDEAVIGYSPETYKQGVAAVEDGADYLGVGPVFGTSTKLDAGEAIGVDPLAAYANLTGLPIVAIGGINASNIGQVVQVGAASAAIVSPVAAADDMEAAARELVNAFDTAREALSRCACNKREAGLKGNRQ